MAINVQVGADLKFEVEVDNEQITLNGGKIDWDIQPIGPDHYHVIAGSRSMDIRVLSIENKLKEYAITINGKHFEVKLGNDLDILLQKMGMRNKITGAMADVKAPMPGLVLDILVNEGELVEKGSSLLILEAMKMENIIKASGTGTVKSIKVKKRDAVEKNQLLIEMS